MRYFVMCFVLSLCALVGAAQADGPTLTPVVSGVEAKPLGPRVAALEAQVAALQQDNGDLAAKHKALYDEFEALSTQVQAMQAKLDESAAAAQQANDLAKGLKVLADFQAAQIQKLLNHTHTYNYPSLGYTNVKIDDKWASYINKWMPMDQTTSPPN